MTVLSPLLGDDVFSFRCYGKTNVTNFTHCGVRSSMPRDRTYVLLTISDCRRCISQSSNTLPTTFRTIAVSIVLADVYSSNLVGLEMPMSLFLYKNGFRFLLLFDCFLFRLGLLPTTVTVIWLCGLPINVYFASSGSRFCWGWYKCCLYWRWYWLHGIKAISAKYIAGYSYALYARRLHGMFGQHWFLRVWLSGCSMESGDKYLPSLVAPRHRCYSKRLKRFSYSGPAGALYWKREKCASSFSLVPSHVATSQRLARKSESVVKMTLVFKRQYKFSKGGMPFLYDVFCTYSDVSKCWLFLIAWLAEVYLDEPIFEWHTFWCKNEKNAVFAYYEVVTVWEVEDWFPLITDLTETFHWL